MSIQPLTNTQCAPPAPAKFVLSIIIANYNYAASVGQAIASALGLDWPALEVIVIDDGSTDDSRGGDRPLCRPHYDDLPGQHRACGGMRRRLRTLGSHGDIVIFLDSDDLLDPSVPREIARVWRAGVSKVQFQMTTIDQDVADLGSVFPQFFGSPTPEEIRRWVLTSSAYPTPPGSGNTYSRKLLNQVFPLDGFSTFIDSFYLAAAPFYGGRTDRAASPGFVPRPRPERWRVLELGCQPVSSRGVAHHGAIRLRTANGGESRVRSSQRRARSKSRHADVPSRLVSPRTGKAPDAPGQPLEDPARRASHRTLTPGCPLAVPADLASVERVRHDDASDGWKEPDSLALRADITPSRSSTAVDRIKDRAPKRCFQCDGTHPTRSLNLKDFM